MTEAPMLQHAGDPVVGQEPSDAEFTIYVDGGGVANPGPSAVAAVVVDSRGVVVVEHARWVGA